MSNSKRELFIIRAVTLICFSFGVAGTLLSIFSNSKSMLFDGMYSLIQSFFILLSAKIFRLITKEPDDDYQFGYSAFEPFFIVIRTTILLTLNLSLLFSAIKAITTGGYLVNGGFVIPYEIVSIVVCLTVYVVLKYQGIKLRSPLLKAESISWLNDGLISIAVLISYIIASLINNKFSYYVDSLVTLIFIFAMSPNLIKIIVFNTRELLNCAPSKEIQDKLESIIHTTLEPLEYELIDYSISKQGRSMFTTIYIKVNKEYQLKNLDSYRKHLVKNIHKKWQWMDVDVIFSSNTDWLELSGPSFDHDNKEIS